VGSGPHRELRQDRDTARTYRLAYGELTASLVKAIQEQQREIATLRQALAAQVAANKAENALHAEMNARLATLETRLGTQAVLPSVAYSTGAVASPR
jgi:hypothetical protein